MESMPNVDTKKLFKGAADSSKNSSEKKTNIDEEILTKGFEKLNSQRSPAIINDSRSNNSRKSSIKLNASQESHASKSLLEKFSRFKVDDRSRK